MWYFLFFILIHLITILAFVCRISYLYINMSCKGQVVYAKSVIQINTNITVSPYFDEHIINVWKQSGLCVCVREREREREREQISKQINKQLKKKENFHTFASTPLHHIKNIKKIPQTPPNNELEHIHYSQWNRIQLDKMVSDHFNQ